MREIARIRNENSVEIIKLRKSLKGKLGSTVANRSKSKENIVTNKS